MNNNSSSNWIILAAILIAGFITGWVIKSAVNNNSSSIQVKDRIIKIHDTMKTPVLEYRIIPEKNYNVDSLISAINEFWKDSLKNLYGKGKFEAKFSKEDKLGKREYTLESRIPFDPETEITIDEELKLPEVYPRRRFGILGGVAFELRDGIAGHVGVKYYVLDFRNFSVSGTAEGKYSFNNFSWHPEIKLETELRF